MLSCRHAEKVTLGIAQLLAEKYFESLRIVCVGENDNRLLSNTLVSSSHNHGNYCLTTLTTQFTPVQVSSEVNR